MSVNDYIRIIQGATIISKEGDNPVVVELPQGLYGVVTTDGDIIVPFGKYDWIDQYCLGITRVKIGKRSNGMKKSKCKWGIIDTKGNELIPLIYDNIWNYKEGPYDTLTLEKDNKEIYVPIAKLLKS